MLASRYGAQFAGADPDAMANTTIGSVLLVFVQLISADVCVVVPIANGVIVGMASSVTDAHAVHADGRSPACSDRARTCMVWPAVVRGGSRTAPVGIVFGETLV